MSWEHTAAARRLRTRGGPLTKTVLRELADRACEFCGLTWPGVKAISDDTQVGVTRVREAVGELVDDGLVSVHAYPNGGRGRSTVYRVLPGHVKHSREAPCRRCQDAMKTHRGAEGIEPEKGTAGRRVSAIPTATGGQNPPRGGDQPSVEPEPPRARAREDDPRVTESSPSGAAAPPLGIPRDRPASTPDLSATAEAVFRKLVEDHD